MKKFLSFILATLLTLSISTIAFAHENADNTFDNFTPGPGLTAPDNWYDPFCYDGDGHVLATCFSDADSTYYCRKTGKIYTNFPQQIPGTNSYYRPYELVDSTSEYEKSEYCPYCGVISNLYCGIVCNDSRSDFTETHIAINDVYFGKECEKCGEFFASKYDSRRDYLGCGACLLGNYDLEHLYRFIPKAYEDAEFSFIFSESEHKFGEGQDGYLEDLGVNSWGYYEGWNPGSSDEPTVLNWWQKIVQFFTNIGIWFINLFSF